MFNRYTHYRAFGHRGGFHRPYRRFHDNRRDGYHHHFKQQHQQHYYYYKPGFKKRYQPGGNGAMSPSMPSNRVISPLHLTINTPQAPPPPQISNNNNNNNNTNQQQSQQLTPVKTPTGSPFQPYPFGRSSMPSSASSSMFSRQYFPSPPRNNTGLSSPPPPPSNGYPSPSTSPKYRPYNFYDHQGSSSLSHQKQQHMQQQEQQQQQQQQHMSQIQNPTIDHMVNEVIQQQKNLKRDLPYAPEFVIDGIYDQEMYNNLVEVSKLREEQAVLQKKSMQNMCECLQIDFKVFHSKLEYEQYKAEDVFFDQLIQKYKDSLTEITNQHQQNQQLQQSD
jgi:hypothetical protein